MSRTSWVIAFCFILTLVPQWAMGQGRSGTDARNRRVYQEHDQATDATFGASTDAGGNAVFSIRGGDFALDKVVSPTGDATIRLTQGKDTVAIALNQSGFEVRRGRRGGRFDPKVERSDPGADGLPQEAS